MAFALDTISEADHIHLPVLETEDGILVVLVDSPVHTVETTDPAQLVLVADSKEPVAGRMVAADFVR